MAPTPSELFSDATSKAEVAQRFEDYKDSLDKAAASSKGKLFAPGNPEGWLVENPAAKSQMVQDRIDNITKGMSSDQLSSIQSELDALKGVMGGDLNKEWAVNFPNAAGLVPYDLEAPAKLLVPRLTPLRNSITRTKGIGTARQFKRITGWTNSGVGGVADASPFFSSTTFRDVYQRPGGGASGGPSLRRGANITYASDSKSVGYVEMGFSDYVNWQAQFAGQGFQDIRQLSQTALLWGHFGGEERALLFARGSGTGYVGAVAAPTLATPSTATTGGSVAAGVYLARVTANTGFGHSPQSNEVTVTTTGSTSTITFTVPAEIAGSLNYNLFVTQAGGATNTETFQTTFVGNSYTLTTAPTSTGALITAGTNASDTSADANAYDGFLSVLTDPNQSGYIKRVNSTLTTTKPGDEFQSALLSLYQSVKADPEEIWCDSNVMKELGDTFKANSSGNNYRLNLDAVGNSGATLGMTVNGIVNQVTGRVVDIKVHPYMPLGAAIVRSRTLPVPDSQVSETTQVVNVQDYMAVDWPVIQTTYDQSTYQYGTLVHYAPAWSGAILGLQ